MNKKVTAYYAVLAAVVALQAVMTIVQGSLVVNHGKKVAQVESQIQELRQEKNQLASTIARETALVSVTSSYSLDGYQPIAHPLVISASSTVAYSAL